MKTKDIVNISLFTTLLAVCSWICIPTVVPFTMQTFAVFLAMLVLGGKKGTIVIGIYMILGMIGIPVFSRGTAGIGVLFGATGGYIIGWIFIGILLIILENMERRMGEKIFPYMNILRASGLITGLIICYLFGTFWFLNVYAKESVNTGFWSVVSVCVFPFIIPDFIKLVLAHTVSRRIKKYIGNV